MKVMLDHRLSFLVGWLNFLIFFVGSSVVHENATEVDVAPRTLSRPKRYLIFPEGCNFQLVYCLTIGAYGRDGDLVLGLTAALAWELPNKVNSKISNLLHRRSRSVVYPKMEAFLQSTGLDGRSCVMRALCEAGQRDPAQIGTGSFVQELLHTIFTLPKDGAKFERSEDHAYDRAYETSGDCERLYPTCQHSIYDMDF
ncbi:hypothetical protein ALC60_07474 [Trachymyrmex zeteki]|uniref:Uncharacterized protein n=1 Tax=Mycetomoellerius zeteki TaxID=64791 RepID=A0A151WZT0_9HYME|nr:PREDICTED: uncharacterized protein LOC108724361 [Trachymyrmex zeteki]KYQ53408.1 hypothetical protein ALC60_07474 [Trachymyrmex zeteki]